MDGGGSMGSVGWDVGSVVDGRRVGEVGSVANYSSILRPDPQKIVLRQWPCQGCRINLGKRFSPLHAAQASQSLAWPQASQPAP